MIRQIERGQANRGSAEIIAMILILPLLLLPLFSTAIHWSNLNQYDVLRQCANQAVLSMEIEGGLTAAGKTRIYEALAEKGVDAESVHLDYTPYPVAYGQPVKIRISCNYQAVTYSLGLGGLTKDAEDKIMVYGPVASLSKKYQ